MVQLPFDIDSFHSEDLDNPLHPSTFSHNDTYDMLILRVPVIKNVFDLEIVSFGFIITKEACYYHDNRTNKLDKLSEHYEGPYRMMDQIVDRLMLTMYTFRDMIATMEESLYIADKQQHFMSQWLRLKRDIVRIERIMSHTTETLNDMLVFYQNREYFPLMHYHDLHEHCERIQRSANLQLEKLDYLYNFYNTRTNEKMNRLIFFLTIISAIFLPLNLFVGFFGMNTSGLPFTAADNGTLKVAVSMLAVTLISSVAFFKWRRKLE